MKTYFYKASKKGKVIYGFGKAINEGQLKNMLLGKELKLISRKEIYSDEKTLPSNDVILFCREMSIVLSSKTMSPKSAVDSIIKHSNPQMQGVLKEVSDGLSRGNSLADSLAIQGCFPDMLVKSVAMGETTSKLVEAFDSAEDYYEKEKDIRGKIRNASIYPIIVLCVFVVALVVMSAVIMPKFTQMYTQYGNKLPFITLFYERLGKFMISFWPGIALNIALLIFVVKRYLKDPLCRKNFDRFKLNNVPLFSKFYRMSLASRFCNVLSLYLNNGTSIQSSLLESAAVLENSSLFIEFQNANSQILKGINFTDALNGINIFPSYFEAMIAGGEQSGGLGEALLKASKSMIKENNYALQSFLEYLNPAIIIVLACMLVPLILAILLPMYGLNVNLH